MVDLAQKLADLSEEKRRLLLRRPRQENLAAACARRQSIPRSDRKQPLPLSFAQERLWFLWQLDRQSAAYNMPIALRLRGRLRLEDMVAILGEVVRRHETLRTTFRMESGVPVQVIGEPSRLELPVMDLREVPFEEREAEVARLTLQETRRPFDLETEPPLRGLLLRVAEEEHVLQLTLHHIAADGWSLGVLIREVGALYASAVTGRPADLPELPVQYADFAQWQRQWLQGPVLEEHLGFWKERLAGAPAVLELPADRPRPRMQSGQGNQHALVLKGDLAAGIRELAWRSGTSVFGVLLSVFQTLLLRQTGREDLVVGTPVANRNRSEIEGLIGFFVNTLALCTDLSGDPQVSDLLERVHRVVLEAQSHQELPFERLVDELRLERSLAHAPLVQVMLGHQVSPRSSLSLPGLEVSEETVGSGTSKIDLTLLFTESPEGLRGSCSYSTDLWDGATVERLLGQYVSLLAGAVASPQARLSELPLLGEAERHQLLAEWNDTERAGTASSLLLHERFSQEAAKAAEHPGVRYEESELTLGEVEARSNRLAHYLRLQGVGPEVRVALFVERSLEMVVSFLGVLKAGGAYVPIDPSSPREHSAYLLEDSGARVVLTQERLLPDLPETPARVICLDRDAAAIEGQSGEAPVALVKPENLAYVIYTSGSTGRPKGVGIEHRQVLSYLDAVLERIAPHTPESYATVSTIAADLGNTVVFTALATGKTLHVISSDRLMDPEGLAEYLSRHRVDCLKIVPSHLAALTAGGAAVLPRRLLILGGEASEWSWVEFLQGRVPGILNHYGPTETTVGVTTYPFSSGVVPHPSFVPLGRPLGGARVHLLDADLSPVPVGVPGELYIGGSSVGRGYLNRADLTADRFRPDLFPEVGGERLYKTGDLARRLPDGSLEFLGRIDHQVKIRGFRVELGEVEAVLGSHPDVRDVAVVVRENGPHDRQLMAFLVPEPGCRTEAGAVRAFVRERLPEAMVPADCVLLAELPLGPTGKLDRKALAALDPGPLPEPASEAPRTPVEEILVEVWAEILKVERVGVFDDFFDLGGHSLLAIRVVSRLRDVFGIEVSLRDFYDKRTPADLAAVIERIQLESLEETRLAELIAELDGLGEDEAAALLSRAQASVAEGQIDD